MLEGLSTAAQRFLLERIEGFEELGVLLLLQRDAARTWTAEAVEVELRLPQAMIAASLKQLARQRLVKESTAAEAGFRYAPDDLELQACVQEVARAWEEDRLAIIGLMNRNAIDRLRNSALRTFSNAFKLKGPESG